MISLSQILNEVTNSKPKRLKTNDTFSMPLGNVVFGDPKDDPEFAELQGEEPGSEKDSKMEKEILDALKKWAQDSSLGERFFARYIDELPGFKKKYPKIFAPNTPIGTRLYRGLKYLNPEIISRLQGTKEEDWRPFMYKKYQFYLYKKPINYKPRTVLQSWTTDKSVALQFSGDAALVTHQDENYYLNQNVLRIIYGDDEKEIIHLGNRYPNNDVYIMLTEKSFDNHIKDTLV